MHSVLIADGDRASRDQIARVLTIDGLRVHSVSRGEDVLRYLAEEAVDVLITEVHLPDMPVWRLLPKLREIDPEMPVITLTSDDGWETSRKVRVEAGPVFFYGLKPLSHAEIHEVTHYAVRWRQKRRGGPVSRCSEAHSNAVPGSPALRDEDTIAGVEAGPVRRSDRKRLSGAMPYAGTVEEEAL